jgi:ankyrin repeat protein
VTALHEAAKRPFAGGVQVLLRGIQPKQLREALNARDKLGRTPLHYAATANRGEAVTALAKAGADLSAATGKLRTPLHAAAYVGAESAVAALLAAGASHAARDDAGDTPLHDAASKGFSQCVELLIAAGADPKITNHAGATTLSLAPPGELRAWMGAPLVSAVSTGDANRVKALLKGGVDPNEANAAGCTALHMAARINSVPCAKALLKAGAFVDLPDKMHNTPLHYAAGFGAYEVAEVLMAAGACTGLKNAKGVRPCHVVPVPPPSAEAIAAAKAEAEAAKAEAEAAARARKAVLRATALAAAATRKQAEAPPSVSTPSAGPSTEAPATATAGAERGTAPLDAHDADVLTWLRARAELEDGPNEPDGPATQLVDSLNPLERRVFLAEARRRGPEAAADDLFARHGVLFTDPAPAPAATPAALLADPTRWAWDFTWGEGRGEAGANERMAAIERRILAQAAAGKDPGDPYGYSSSEDEFEHGRAPEPVAYAPGFALADEPYDDDASGSWSLPPSSRPPSPPRPRIRRPRRRSPTPSPSVSSADSEPPLPPAPERLPSDLLERYDVMMQRADARRAGMASPQPAAAAEAARRAAAEKARQEQKRRQAAKDKGTWGTFQYDSDGELVPVRY